jgi:hypothetical protein
MLWGNPRPPASDRYTLGPFYTRRNMKI